MKKETYKGSNGIDQIAYWIEAPEGTPKGVIQIAHGMAEHYGRYRDVIEYFRNQGFVVCGNDHLGHGETASCAEDLGYFGKKKGWQLMSEDMYGLTLRAKEEYGELPYFLLGHSMGSLLARVYMIRYATALSGVILSGTSGPNPTAKLAAPLVAVIAALKGERHRSKLIYDLAFGNYTERYEKGTDRLGWMSQDTDVLAAFRRDPLCNFTLTVAGFRDLMELLIFVTRSAWSSEVPSSLPLLFISGEMDPVGDYGAGVRTVCESLKASGHRDLTIKLYEDTRHEALNEPVRVKVMEDIITWIASKKK